MRYMGSKKRHAKHLLPIILKDRVKDQWYVEPFVGGFNIIDKVSGNRIANDTNHHLIELFKAIQSGWIPPESISEKEYKHAKVLGKDFPPYLIGFVGFGCSHSGKWFGGYARGGFNVGTGLPRNYCAESKRSILKQAAKIKDVIIKNVSYEDLSIPSNSIIYCDPPYQHTTKYANEFSHKKFWQWCRNMASLGHKVFISEYTAPDDFVCLWERVVNNTLDKDTGSKQGVEKLFTWAGKSSLEMFEERVSE